MKQVFFCVFINGWIVKHCDRLLAAHFLLLERGDKAEAEAEAEAEALHSSTHPSKQPHISPFGAFTRRHGIGVCDDAMIQNCNGDGDDKAQRRPPPKPI